MFRKVLFLIIAVTISIVATFVQQIFSSDSPVKHSVKINNIFYDFKLPVVHDGNEECVIELLIPDTSISGDLNYKLLKGNNVWKQTKFIRMQEKLVSVLPYQKPNIKLEYFLTLKSGKTIYNVAKSKPAIIRFQGIVPKVIQFPQVLIIFIVLIMVCFTGILALFKIGSFKKYATITFYLIFSGAFILGLVVHLIAFRHLLIQIAEFNDLTFYKNLLITLIWLALYYFNRKYTVSHVTLVVSILTLVLFCIPQHMLFGWIHY